MADTAPKKKLASGRHVSAIKRHRQSLKKEEQNRTLRSSLKTLTKKVRAAVESKNKDLAVQALKEATSKLGKAAKKGIIHQRNAFRHISSLSKLVNRIAA